jgi:uncharacterized protein YraI
MRMEQFTAGARAGLTVLLAVALVALLGLGSGVTSASAQGPSEPFPTGAVVRVANTDGQRLNLRDGASAAHTIVAKLAAGETLTVTGASQTVAGMRWLPVRTTGTSTSAQSGWVSADYVTLVSAPSPTPTRTPTLVPTPTPDASASPSNTDGSSGNQSVGRAIQVEAKLKFPELDGNKQEITIWVTRDGVPIPGATVTLESNDGGDEERFRELDPTDDEGRTRREFDVRQEKGTVELQIEAVAPDGGEGTVTVSYFRR